MQMNKKNILLSISIILIIAGLITKSISTPLMVCLILSGIWLCPFIQSFLQKVNYYFSDVIIVIISIVIILTGVGLAFANYYLHPKEAIHKHTVSDWVYDEETGFEYKKCPECGEIFEKRVPNLEYSTYEPIVDEEFSDENNENNENTENNENSQNSTNNTNNDNIEKPTPTPNNQYQPDKEKIEDKAEEETDKILDDLNN